MDNECYCPECEESNWNPWKPSIDPQIAADLHNELLHDGKDCVEIGDFAASND